MLARLAALNHAVHYLGVHEVPAGSNSGPYITGWLRSAGVPNHNPWCMAFLHAMFAQVGVILGGGASVGNFETWARKHGTIVRVPKPGDVACYDWNNDRWPDHVGIVHHLAPRNGEIVHWDGTVERTRTGDVIAVEGNTAIGNDSDGGRVMFRPRRQSVCKFVRIPGNAKPAV
jgi:hypothetical protein